MADSLGILHWATSAAVYYLVPKVTTRRASPPRPAAKTPTPRHLKICLGLAAGIGLLIAGLAIAATSGIDPKKIIEQCNNEIAEIRAIVEPIERDKRATAALANPDYRKYALSPLKPFEREAGGWHEAAQWELAARKEVPAFLARVDEELKTPLNKTRYHKLMDEASSLYDNHCRSTFKPKLEKAKQRIENAAPPIVATWTSIWPAFYRDLTSLVKAGSSVAAFERIESFETTYADVPEALKKAGELRQTLLHEEEKYISRLIAEADASIADGRAKVQAAIPKLRNHDRLDEWLRKHP